MISKDKVIVAQGIMKKDGQSINTLEGGLRAMSECGCGLDCQCLGALILPVFDSSVAAAGVIGFAAVYLTSANGGTTIVVNSEMMATAPETLAALR